MLRPTTLTALSLLGAASARIVGIAAPSQIAPNSDFTITIITENYIQSVLDISAVFGLTNTPYPGYLGNVLTSTYLGPLQSNILTNISVDVTLPSEATSGYSLTAAITSIYGASSEVTTTLFTLPNIIVSSPTSSDLVSDTEGTDLCAATSTASATATATVASSAAARRRATGAGATLSDLPNIIQTVNVGLTNLIQDLQTTNTTSAQSTYNSLSGYFGEIFSLAVPKGSCDSSVTGRQLTLSEAIGIIQTIQGTLSSVMQDVTDGDGSAAFTDACAVLADYFSSGLHEFVFGPGQASGTGQ
ncbi:hypothetical protein LTR08_005244 [Meristemomyces frigidus]|nr:hypothetical protein LTR08_005244 [Meristemomyces frigidus]